MHRSDTHTAHHVKALEHVQGLARCMATNDVELSVAAGAWHWKQNTKPLGT